MIRSTQQKLVVETVTDPNEIARSREQSEQYRKNSRWLQTHWEEILPAARGKFIVVADQEFFLADSPEEAWAWAEKQHPEDRGALVRYIFRKKGPKVNVGRGLLGNR